MPKNTSVAERRGQAENGIDSIGAIQARVASLDRKLRDIRGDVDRLTLKERIDSLAARMARLEALLQG